MYSETQKQSCFVCPTFPFHQTLSVSMGLKFQLSSLYFFFFCAFISSKGFLKYV